MAESSLNTQMVDSVAAVNFVNNGSSQANSQAMLNAVMAETLGMAMHNAVMRQQSNSMVSSAATTAACAKMLQASPGMPMPPLPPSPTPPGPDIPPLDGGPEGPVAVAAATVQADRAVQSLEAEATSSSSTQKQATSALKGIASSINNFVSNGGSKKPAKTTKPSGGKSSGSKS